MEKQDTDVQASSIPDESSNPDAQENPDEFWDVQRNGDGSRVWLYHIGFGSLVYTVEKFCDGSGEDPTCSRHVSRNSISDHLAYFRVQMGCDDVVTCKILMGPRLAAYNTQDQSGNFIMSMSNSNSIIKTNVETGQASYSPH
ncbi:hypothetical protein POM88_049533 [Heracleum sosnowskyi]|uniref:Uncharacterized protein n=1 Tax=Heracleum sosnowskyi TaxID=360622 RepID=A0AAD8GXX2_9APIA|nr:hypothetical protein POM88_049533 [Heracleum sosnowskyi]